MFNLEAIEQECNLGYPNLEVEKLIKTPDGFYIEWCDAALGWGEMYAEVKDDGKMHVDTECMSDDFVSAVFREIVKSFVREG